MFGRKLFYGQDEDDPNINYTGWDLPENPELRAWIQTLAPIHDEDLYQLVYYDEDEVLAECQLMLQKNQAESLEVLDLNFLAAHRGELPPGIERATHISLEAPEVEGQRREIARYLIQR